MYSKKSKYSEYAKYQKYKSKYLELQKSISQFGGGVKLRIKIHHNIKKIIDDRPDLQILKDVFIKPDTLYEIISDNEVAIKLLELCKENPSWDIREGNKRIPKDEIDKLAWQSATYSLSPKQVLDPVLDPVLVPVPRPVPQLDQDIVHLQPYRLDDFATQQIGLGYLDLRKMPRVATGINYKYKIDSEYTPTTCMGHTISTNFDTGNGAMTLFNIDKARQIGLPLIPKMTSKDSILMYNSLVDLYRMAPQTHKIRVVPAARAPAPAARAPGPAPAQRERYQDLHGLAIRNVADQRALEYEQITLQDFVKKLDILLPMHMEGLDEEVRYRKPISEIKKEFYVMCGIQMMTGIGGTSDIYFHKTLVPIEVPVLAEDGRVLENFKFFVKADVGNLLTNNLLLSNEDIRKLSLYGAKLDFVDRSHLKRNRLLDLKKQFNRLKLEYDINVTIRQANLGDREDVVVIGELHRLDQELLTNLRNTRLEEQHDIPITKFD